LSDKSKIKPTKCSILIARGAGNRVRTTWQDILLHLSSI
jgi:hypothetical protein